MPVSPIPDGYHTVSPYLIAEDAGQLLEFMQKAFGAKETFRMEMPDGSVGHAEVRIGDSVVMVGGAGGAWPAVPAAIHLYVPDVDATYQAALAAGARSTEEPADQVMEQLLASRSVSITELKRSPSTVIEQAGSEPIAVLNHNRPAAYLLPQAAYQELLDRLQAAEIREAIAASRNDPRAAIAADTVFAELDALIDEAAAEQGRP